MFAQMPYPHPNPPTPSGIQIAEYGRSFAQHLIDLGISPTMAEVMVQGALSSPDPVGALRNLQTQVGRVYQPSNIHQTQPLPAQIQPVTDQPSPPPPVAPNPPHVGGTGPIGAIRNIQAKPPSTSSPAPRPTAPQVPTSPGPLGKMKRNKPNRKAI